jgi:hypothetical protein
LLDLSFVMSKRKLTIEPGQSSIMSWCNKRPSATVELPTDEVDGADSAKEKFSFSKIHIRAQLDFKKFVRPLSKRCAHARNLTIF